MRAAPPANADNKRMALSIARDDLCSYLTLYHSLDNFDRQSGESGVMSVFARLGSVQYDPLNVVGRNPSLVLQSRVGGYAADILDKLLYKDRVLVDGWDKEMSIYAAADWQRFGRIRARRGEAYKSVLAWRGQTEILSHVERAMEEIRSRGPLASKDIDSGRCSFSSWGHKKISGAALDYLFSVGRLGVHGKKNAIKTYDAIENLLPKDALGAEDPFADDAEFCEWYVARRIGSIGAHWLRSGLGWNGYFINDKKLRAETFDALARKGLIVKARVPEINEDFYMRQQDVALLREKPDYDNCVRFLAPLDNMLWDRLMAHKLFGFRYTWEVYVPAEKRKYGYYVLPALYQNRLVARMEPQKHDAGMPLSVKNWWWEPGTAVTGRIKQAVKNGLNAFARYLRADGIDKKSLEKVF